MRIAHVAGLGTYRQIDRYGTISLFHAPLAVLDSDYFNYFSAMHSKRYVILDTCAFENSIGTCNIEIKDSDLLDIAINSRVHEVICPDIPFSPAESTKRTLEFVKLWRRLPEAVRPNIMLVPHGNSTDDWLRNLELLLAATPANSVGIPRILFNANGEGTRLRRIRLARRLKNKVKHLSIHFLGAGEDVLEELSTLRVSNLVRSMDTTFLHRHLMTDINPLVGYAKPQPLYSRAAPYELTCKLSKLVMAIERSYANGSIS